MSTHQLPFFPLPGLVLFPHTHLPLHIFEPRYVSLVRDVLEQDQHMATANIRQSDQMDYFGNPKVYKTITEARIVDYHELPNDRYEILLEGVCRARILEELPTEPYRVARAESLTDILHQADRSAINVEREEMLMLARKLAARFEMLDERLKNIENAHLHPGIIADVIASLVVKDTYARQGLLEELEVRRRIRMVIVQLKTLLARLREQAPEDL